MKNIPDIFLFKQNKQTCLGGVSNIIDFTEDVRFNACSEISFTVADKYYDIDEEKWKDNPVYDKLERNKLLFVADDTEYFEYPVREIGGSNFYKYKYVDHIVYFHCSLNESTSPYTVTLFVTSDSSGQEVIESATVDELSHVTTDRIRETLATLGYTAVLSLEEGTPIYNTHGTATNQLTARTSDYEMRFDQNPNLSHFQVQEETELFDIGTEAGYSFQHFSLIAQGASYRSEGSIINYYPNSSYSRYFAAEAFIPVKPYDIIALNTGMMNNGDARYQWHSQAYFENDSSTFARNIKWEIGIAGQQRNAALYTIDPESVVTTSDIYKWQANGGCVRFYYIYGGDCPITITQESDEDYSRYPSRGYAKIFSGERRCTSIDNVGAQDRTVSYPMQWFQIVSVEEDNDGISCTKHVTAYSYEYTLSDTTFSLSESTLPLYIPDAITNLVESNTWIRDFLYYSGSYSNVFRSPQVMQRGVLNQILEYLPGWSIGYVSSELMTTYRTLGDVDNVDVYSYLMDTVQASYNCFIVFDNENQTISAYTLSDINSMNSGVALTWNNSIKKFAKSNMDASYFTALRVKTGDDTYGIGVVNPTGNSMVYNFNRILDDLDYKIVNDSRTMKDAATAWMTAYANELSDTSSTGYRAKSLDLIDANMSVIKAESARKLALSNYLAKTDEINSLLASANVSLTLYDSPESPGSIRSKGNINNTNPYYNDRLRDELAMLSTAFYNADIALNGNWYIDSNNVRRKRYSWLDSTEIGARKEYENAYSALQSKALTLTLNYKKALKANGNNSSSRVNTVLSADEIKELSKYIVEGVWTYEDITFSEEYNAKDIHDTLLGVLNGANYDLSNRLSIPNFDFTIDSANILAVPELERQAKALRLGHSVYIDTDSNDGILTPILLEMHIDYKDDNNFSFTFTTDMKRKPIQFRFADLYGTISQTSVTDSSFTFDT